ncbi:MAG TPA: kelch repeat-containing protein, partial [Labilithrix sp.]
TLGFAPPYAWNALPYGGDAPPTTDTLGYDFSVYDATGDRVLASFLHDVTCFPGEPMPCKAPGLWSFALATQTWTKLADTWTSNHAYAGARPFLVDQAGRRILTPSDGVLVSTSLDPSNTTLADVTLAQDGDLGPSAAVAATVLGDGRIVSTDGGAFRVLDPSALAPRWSRFGTATFPATLDRDSSLSADTKTGELLLFGGAGAELHVVSADGKTIAKATPTGASPPARSLHGAVVSGGVLYVAGGSPASGAPGDAALDDVWSFDRGSSAWTKIATLPEKILGVTIAPAASGELLVSGRTAGNASAPSHVYAIDPKTHAIRTLDAPGTKYPLWAAAPYRGCMLGYESGDTVDGSSATVWRCTIDGDKLTWTSTKLDEHDFTLNDLRAAASPDGLHAYFVGRHLWDVVGM